MGLHSGGGGLYSEGILRSTEGGAYIRGGGGMFGVFTVYKQRNLQL